MDKRFNQLLDAGRRFFRVPSGPAFSELVPPSAILDVPLADIELVILRSVNSVAAGNVFDADMAVSHWSRSYPKAIQLAVSRRLIEAWQGLNNGGLVAESKVMGVYETWFVTEKGRQALDAGTTVYGAADLLPIGLLLPRMNAASLALYNIGHFDAACAAAFKQLEMHVRELCGFPDDAVGLDLMRRAFMPDVGPLTLLQAPKAEQVAVRDLFTGAIGYFRNPLAHRDVEIASAAQAASAILFANELVAIALRHHILRNNRADAP